jgi:hypothetical protein
MTTDTLFDMADRYERRFDLSDEERFRSHDFLDLEIQNFLITWVASIPQEALHLYGKSLQRAIQFIIKRRFILRGTFMRGNEIGITYLNDGQIAYQITILPQKVLLLDVEEGSKEAAYPVEWTSEWITCQTREEKLSCYRDFLDSKKHKRLIILGAEADEREVLLKDVGEMDVNITILEEGCVARTLKNTAEDSLVKSILYRKQKEDSIVKAYQFRSSDYCMYVEFVPEKAV